MISKFEAASNLGRESHILKDASKVVLQTPPVPYTLELRSMFKPRTGRA